MTDITLTAKEAREIAASVARSIRYACRRLTRGDVSAERFEGIEDACDEAVDAAMEALADAFPSPTPEAIPADTEQKR